MPTSKCPNSSPCLDPTIPVTNYSSEMPDTLQFLGAAYPIVNPNDPIDGDKTFTAQGCLSECESEISQEDADLCAARQAFMCANGGPDGGKVLFFNHVQSYSLRCPDGSVFTYVVKAGLFVNTTQALADSQAQAYARLSASTKLLCMGSPSITQFCVGQPVTITIPVTGGGVTQLRLVEITSGTLPPGLSIGKSITSGSIVISGTPTSSYLAFFVIRVSTLDSHMSKSFTLCAEEIGPNLLVLNQGQPVLESFLLGPCAVAVKTWKVESGLLPPGLTLNPATGFLTGTPTSGGSFSVVISAQT